MAVALALSCAGCFEVSTAEVRVRDTSAVTLESRDGTDVLPVGAPEGVVGRGEYWEMLSRVPYEVRARRDAAGAIELRCDACAAAEFPVSGTGVIGLLDGQGRTRAAPSWSVAVDSTRVVVDYELCMVQGHRTCAADLPVRLTVPARDVAEVRRRIEPLRLWGYALLAFGAASVAAATYVMLAPGVGGSFAERAPWGGAVLAPGLVLGGIGLWEVLTPAREQIWTP